MKILFINQFFWPDSSATSQQLTDLATGLAARGHQVTVLCGEGGYAAAASSNAPAGVRIVRTKTLPYTRAKLARLLSYVSFHVTAAAAAVTLPRHDVVVSFTTPPLISIVGSLVKATRGSAHFVYEHDLYPDVAVDLEYLKAGGFLDRVIGFIADASRRHADGVIALGECMKARLVARGIPAERITLAPDWANAEAIQPMPRPGDRNELVLLYSGNLGLAHDLDTLTGALKVLRGDSRFRFLFVGSGGKRAELAAFCKANEIQSVEFRPYVDRDKLAEGLAAGDIGLVTQTPACCGSVVPSKVYGILAAGRPVLFIGPNAATPSLIIDRYQCGWHVECGDVEGLTRLLLDLSANRELVVQAGVRARQALLDHYDLPQSIDRIATILESSGEPDIDLPLAPSHSRAQN